MAHRLWGMAGTILQGAICKAADMGYVCKVGAECEFYLFELDENGEPTETPQDKAGYLDVAPLDKGENIPPGDLPEYGADGAGAGKLAP